MHPFDVLLRLGLGGDPDRMPLPGVHSGLRSPAGPDATPRSRRPRRRPSRHPQRRSPYRHPNPDLAGIRRLTHLTGAVGLPALAAAQALFAPHLRKEGR
jgi:hypothetical protein